MMRPRLSRLPRIPIGVLERSITPRFQHVCPICSISPATKPIYRRHPGITRLSQVRIGNRIPARRQSSLAPASANNGSINIASKDSRSELREALVELQKCAESYVNISRLQLALRGLEQAAGNETIRIAIYGLQSDGRSLDKAKTLARALIADPLKEEEEWERILLQETGENPVLLRIGKTDSTDAGPSRLAKELRISWPKMNENNLEILILGLDPEEAKTSDSLSESVLVSTMDIPTSSTGRYTPVTTPVHRALILGNGVLGTASLIDIMGKSPGRVIYPVTNVLVDGAEESSIPFQIINIGEATDAIQSFRQDVNKAIYYEQKWFHSGLEEISTWLAATTPMSDGTMKEPVRDLIKSLLEDTLSAVQADRSSRLVATLSSRPSSATRDSLRGGLSHWAENAHTELRDQLDIAFGGRRWKKLGWWKLFWRVDDVSMITSDILNQRFLTNAEKEAIFLSGRFDESLEGFPQEHNKNWAYKHIPDDNFGYTAPPPTIRGLMGIPEDDIPTKSEMKPWPLHIPAARSLLLTGSVPALQALAQKLMLQTLTTSGFSSALAGLIYVSTLTTSVYEAGAVAALGIVWSLRRMQGKWETARKFWEGEVREEGRKAVRGTESLLNTALSQPDPPLEGSEERHTAIKAIEKAKSALETCK